MLTVACVLSDPIRAGHRDYGPEHVDRLKAMVAEHLASPHRFVCIDDSPYKGWWAKVSLFEPGRFTGRVMYLDLDVTVVGPLDDLAYYAAPFTAIRDWQFPMTINSSVMAWDAGVADRVFTEFTPEVMERYPGDQSWINNRISAARFPREWCRSYKWDAPIEDTRVIVYHGHPKPWEEAA